MGLRVLSKEHRIPREGGPQISSTPSKVGDLPSHTVVFWWVSLNPLIEIRNKLSFPNFYHNSLGSVSGTKPDHVFSKNLIMVLKVKHDTIEILI